MAEETEALISLHTQLIDASEGYGEGLELAKDPAIVVIFRDLCELHRASAEELSTEIARRAAAPEDDGSFMATVHKAILNLRALLTGLDENVLPGVIDGEERIVASYDRALETLSPGSPLQSILTRQREDVQHRIVAMRESAATA